MSLSYLTKAEEAYSLQDKGDSLPKEIEQWQRGNRSTLEQNLTQTYFYFAQVYSKNGNTHLGIDYSCRTMQRQLSTNTHTVKDFVLNCIHLTDYFSS